MGVRSNVIVRADGKVVGKTHNVTTNVGRSRLAEAALSTTPLDLRIRYAAIGTGTVAPTQDDTRLQTETNRVPIGLVTRNSTQIQFNILFGNPPLHFREVGLFFGETATSALNSGIMLNRATLNHDNTFAQNDLEVEIIITYSDR